MFPRLQFTIRRHSLGWWLSAEQPKRLHINYNFVWSLTTSCYTKPQYILSWWSMITLDCVSWQSNIHIGNFYTGKTVYFYWVSPHNVCTNMLRLSSIHHTKGTTIKSIKMDVIRLRISICNYTIWWIVHPFVADISVCRIATPSV